MLKRGSLDIKPGVKLEAKEKGKTPVGPWVLGVLVFVVVGSSVFQVIQMITSSSKLFG